MKLLMVSVVTASLFFVFAPKGVCQQTPRSERPYLRRTESPRLHFTIPSTESTGRVEFAASSAERDWNEQRDSTSTETESVLRLRGSVEAMMCPPGGHGCDNGSIVLHADTIDYNEKTREIAAHGDVHIGFSPGYRLTPLTKRNLGSDPK
jgi:hypothetical protein